jgi:hypothetical protein
LDTKSPKYLEMAQGHISLSQVRLSCVELTPLARAYDPSGVGHRGRPVEALSEGVSHKGSRCYVVTASPRVYFLQ